MMKWALSITNKIINQIYIYIHQAVHIFNDISKWLWILPLFNIIAQMSSYTIKKCNLIIDISINFRDFQNYKHQIKDRTCMINFTLTLERLKASWIFVSKSMNTPEWWQVVSTYEVSKIGVFLCYFLILWYTSDV